MWRCEEKKRVVRGWGGGGWGVGGGVVVFFFFNDTATTEIYTLSLHDALPISVAYRSFFNSVCVRCKERIRNLYALDTVRHRLHGDRKSTRLNSSH